MNLIMPQSDLCRPSSHVAAKLQTKPMMLNTMSAGFSVRIILARTPIERKHMMDPRPRKHPLPQIVRRQGIEGEKRGENHEISVVNLARPVHLTGETLVPNNLARCTIFLDTKTYKGALLPCKERCRH